jgi:hypothetical protein
MQNSLFVKNSEIMSKKDFHKISEYRKGHKVYNKNHQKKENYKNKV